MNILINKNYDIEDLFPIFNSEKSKKKPEPITLTIDYAKHFPMDRLLKLGSLASGSKLEIHAVALGDIDFTELVFAALCNTSYIHIPDDCKINMVSIVPVDKDALSKIAKLVALKTTCKLRM
ncbi:MAG: hypothetical protein IPG09_03505 [Ignavibacteria bacterium]|nr:hypothetical protein [Ignavibacteria bacterium]